MLLADRSPRMTRFARATSLRWNAAKRATGRAEVWFLDWIVARRTELLELAFVLLALGGVAMMHLPTAMILGGVLGMFACERRSGAARQRSPVPEPRSERVA